MTETESDSKKIPAINAAQADRDLPDNIRQAVLILNNPEEYTEEYDWVDRQVSDSLIPGKEPLLNERIHAKAEYVETLGAWTLYVKWDDHEPNTAKFLVHDVVKELRIPYFHSSGRVSKWAKDGASIKKDEDGNKIPQFGRTNAEGAYLRVANIPKRK